MKKGILVTEKNMAMILGHIKKVLKKKTSMATRSVYTKHIKRVNEFLNLIDTDNFVEKDREPIMGTRSLHDLSSCTINILSRKINVRESFFYHKSIVIYNPDTPGSAIAIINIGDKVRIYAQKIIIRLKPWSDGSSYFTVWELDKINRDCLIAG